MDLLVLPKAATIPMISRPSQKTTSYSNTNTQLDLLDLPKPSAIPRIPRAKTNPDWQLTNLEMTNSGSTNALVTKDHTENRANGGYNGPYDDTRSYNSRSPSRMGNGHTRGNYSEWTTRNPYDQPDEDRMRRY
ncbi:mucin-13b [Trichomycterus rosablanca]|uniref:mucin-13b n=1 Tax=Trichomycterus rosablanca TaxID=2290929 RepID=UPI002F35D70A